MICLLLWVWFGTGYKLKEELIKIKSGPFRTTIKIKDIKKVRSVTNDSITMSYLSGPALSVDQLEITYGETFDIVNISPDHTSNFLKILLYKNSNIEIDKILKLIQHSNAIGKGPNFVNLKKSRNLCIINCMSEFHHYQNQTIQYCMQL